MEATTDTKPIEIEVTPDLLVEKAAVVDNNLKEIGIRFPRTSDAIVWDQALLPDQKEVEDTDVIAALNLVTNFSAFDHGSPEINFRLSRKTAESYCNGKSHDLNRIVKALDALVVITSHKTPKELREQIRKQAADINRRVTPMVNGTWEGNEFLYETVLPKLVSAGNELDKAAANETKT
jgi:hypothetical protein